MSDCKDFSGRPGMNRRSLIGAAVSSASAFPFISSRASSAVNAGRSPLILPAQTQWTPPPRQYRARTGLAALRDVKLRYWDTGGNGEPLVLLHPATGSDAVWAYQQPEFAARGYRVIGYSRRGHLGSESGPPGNAGTGAEDLDQLADFIGIDRFHLVGSAWGGFIVPDYALLRPERLLSMVIACSQGGVIEPGYRETIARLSPPGFNALPASFRELGPSYRAANPAGVATWEALERRSHSTATPIRQAAKHQLYWSALERIRIPALVVAGGADLYAPVPLMMELARHLPNSETAILSESGHSGYWEQPIAFNSVVLDFLRRHSARRGA